MSNEELTVLIQAGDQGLLPELWRNVQRYARKKAAAWPRAGLETEDMMQMAFLALLAAVDSFSPGKGPFLPWYSLRLKAAFTDATGQRTERQRRDPLRDALSLDTPLDNEEGDITLGDTIPDPAAELALEAVEERDRRQRLHDVLKEALTELPGDMRAEIINRYWRNCPGNANIHQAALRFLRHPRWSKRLMALR